MSAPILDSVIDAAAPPATVELSVVLPVFNEEEALPAVLDEALAALDGADFSHEIVLLDDASTDRTPDILRDFQRRYPETVRLLRHERNRGIAAACSSLYAGAHGRFVFINGSDGQWRTAECLRMMALRHRFDVVVGRRVKKQYRLGRQLVSAAFNLLPRLLFGVAVHDAGSIKLFRREVLALPLLSRGPFREAERLVRRSGAATALVPSMSSTCRAGAARRAARGWPWWAKPWSISHAAGGTSSCGGEHDSTDPRVARPEVLRRACVTASTPFGVPQGVPPLTEGVCIGAFHSSD